MPDVVDADVDDDEGRLLVQDVFVEPGFEIGNAIAADPGADHFDLQIGIFFGKLFFGERDVAARRRRRPA